MMDNAELVAILRRLSLNVKESVCYTGGMGGRDLYEPCKTVQLLFDGEVISEVFL